MNKDFNAEYNEILGYSPEKIIKVFADFKSARKKNENLWKVIDAIDKGRFWDTVAKRVLPGWAVKPDTNYINYVKTNYVNSIYVGSYKATVFPRKREHMGVSNSINEFLEYKIDKIGLPHLQALAGERAALLNFGAIQLGWSKDVVNGLGSPVGDLEAGLDSADIEARFIDNMSLYLDPSTKEYLKGRALFIEEEIPFVELVNEKRFAERLLAYAEELDRDPYAFGEEVAKYIGANRKVEDGMVRFVTGYYKYFDKENGGYRIDQVWFINENYFIGAQTNMKPKTFPVRVLYCNTPTSDPYGVSTSKLILNNAITINLLDSVESSNISNTIDASNIISRSLGLPEALFSKFGNAPGKNWFANGDVRNGIAKVPSAELPQERFLHRQTLERSIFMISGVDERYTGRDTGSIQTTGGMDIMNQRTTMSDNSRILELQKFIQDLHELVLSFYVHHAGKKAYPKHKQDNTTEALIEVDFEEIRKNQLEFDFTCNIAPNLPKNEIRLAEEATRLLEMQMQYGGDPQLITIEEWLSYQNLPMKYHILRRLQDDRMRDDREEVQADLISYSGMVERGMRPESAVNQLANERAMKRQSPGLGSTGGSVQSRQAG